MEKRNDISEVIEIPRGKNNKLKKTIINVVAVLLGLFILVFAGVTIYMNSVGINFINTDDNNEGDNTNDNVLFDELSDDEKDEYHDIITAIRDNSDISSTLKSWYTNGGDHMNSKNVLNVLIVGLDGRNGSMKGNSDVMMLASVNKKDKKITLCSFLRDSYTYFETSTGKGYYSKLNAAYANGGADCLISAIENNYKIDIDYFVAVDFTAFEKVIDAIGGINLNITETEAKAMESYGKIYGVPVGENVLLNGEQALLYSRMRKIYATGDVHRTENQRKVINAIIKKSKTLSISDLNDVLQTLGEYIYTDCPSTKIISLGTNAILGKWYNFQVYSMEAPPESAREAYNGNSWMWMVDYPYSAQYVQKQIYGESNIVIK